MSSTKALLSPPHQAIMATVGGGVLVGEGTLPEPLRVGVLQGWEGRVSTLENRCSGVGGRELMAPRVRCPASCLSVLAFRCLRGERRSVLSPDVLNSFLLEAPTPWLLLRLHPSTWQTRKLASFWDHPRLAFPPVVPPLAFPPIAKPQCGLLLSTVNPGQSLEY